MSVASRYVVERDRSSSRARSLAPIGLDSTTSRIATARASTPTPISLRATIAVHFSCPLEVFRVYRTPGAGPSPPTRDTRQVSTLRSAHPRGLAGAPGDAIPRVDREHQCDELSQFRLVEVLLRLRVHRVGNEAGGQHGDRLGEGEC